MCAAMFVMNERSVCFHKRMEDLSKVRTHIAAAATPARARLKHPGDCRPSYPFSLATAVVLLREERERMERKNRRCRRRRLWAGE